jgi:hypothetical protein
MKLKSIMYALDYSKSPKQLSRTEGARRVKQASVMMKCRKTQQLISYVGDYGTEFNLKLKGIKERSVSAPETFGVPYGYYKEIH